MRFLCVYFLLLSIAFPSIFAQKGSSKRILKDARSHIEALCSDSFAGRGYVDDGHKIAAQYIEQHFKEFNLSPLPSYFNISSFLQPFPLVINLIQDGNLSYRGQPFLAGKDFIVNRYSGNGQANGKLIDAAYGLETIKGLKGQLVLIRDGWPQELIDQPERQKDFANKRLILDRIRSIADQQPAGLIIASTKLTHGFARFHFDFPIIEIVKSSLPETLDQEFSFSVDAALSKLESQNVIGMVKGSQYPDSFLVLSAHYDHLGKWGDTYFPGANDNASGTALLLSLARHYSIKKNQPTYSILFIAFGGEETGLTGSRYYVEKDQIIPLENMKFMLNLDLMGNGDKGITAVGGVDYPSYLETLIEVNEAIHAVPVVRKRKNAPNSDHYFFLENGVPGFFIYTLGGPPHYHDINDNKNTILLSRFTELRQLFIRFLDAL